MNGFKRFIFRPAREPFWQKVGQDQIAGLTPFFGGLFFLMIAYFLTAATVGSEYGPTAVLSGTAGNGSGWGELLALVVAGPFWLIGGLASLFGGFLLAWSLMSWFGTRWAQRLKKEK